MIYGNLISFNGMPEIVRCLDSLYLICDKIYVCDGYSTDGTWEYLNNVKDIYNLVLYQRKLDTFVGQRNWLLNKTPKNSWIISLDQDEAFSSEGKKIPDFLNAVSDEELKKDSLKQVMVAFIQLNNLKTRLETVYMNGAKIFYYDDNTHFGLNDYHALPCCKNKSPWVNKFELPAEIVIKHYANLDPAKMKLRCKRIPNSKDAGKAEYEFWCKMKHKMIDLPRELW